VGFPIFTFGFPEGEVRTIAPRQLRHWVSARRGYTTSCLNCPTKRWTEHDTAVVQFREMTTDASMNN